MSKREIYSSEDAMRSAMQGKWTHYSLGRSAMWQWVIDGDIAYRIYNSDNELEKGRDITWNPSKGTIFEYVLGILWYKASKRHGKILNYMKLSLDADLLPKTHAAGSEADIVYEYEATECYLEHRLLL